MERIIITEVDNTSNVESLSSYDIVYVPGFSNNGASPSFESGSTLFRTPTLVTSKYEFLRLFGQNGIDSCPTFPKDQPYPIAGETAYGFPPYAIPGYVPPETPTIVSGITDITCDASASESEIIETIENTGFYTHVEVDAQWEPEDGVVYYLASSTLVETVLTFSMSRLEESESSYVGLYIFTSNTSPVANGWMVKYGDEYIYTDDTYIEFVGDSDNAVVKTYYIAETSPAIMFNGPTSTVAGDADPGYRYAMYLLSLGIPVYYEQMNSSFEEVDLNDPTMAAASPVEKDWFIEVEGNYIRTDDTSVQPGQTYYMGADISVTSMYKGLESRFANRGDGDASSNPSDYSFDSIGDYAIKYITSGGYPTFEYGPLASADASGIVYGTSPLAEQMIRLAADREDAVALIDHTNNPNRTIYETDTYSVIKRIRDEFSNLTTTIGSYGAMFTPWYTCTNSIITGGTTNNYEAQMPASLAFLSALAQQIKDYNPWLAVSGVSRGPVPYCGGLHTNFVLTNNVADSYQLIPGDTESLGSASISINPITYIRNYGYCIWGNRTLRNNSAGTQATSFLNIRDLVSDIKKRLYEASQRLLFEQNTDILWLNFKSIVTPLLDTMVSNYILSDYNIIKYNIDPETGQPVPAYKILAVIRIIPINSVEVFELQVQLENSEVTVAEVE